MTRAVEDLVVLASPDDSVATVVERMAAGTTRYFGIALVVDSRRRLHGLLNDGDVLRLIARGIDLSHRVEEFMTTDPVTVQAGSSDDEILQTTRSKVWHRSAGEKQYVRYVPLVESDGVVHDVVDVVGLLARSPRRGDHVEIYGLGFVGVTLAVALSGRGHIVHGVDPDAGIVARLSSGNPHVFEPRLTDMLAQSLRAGTLSFSTGPPDIRNDVAIIAVGTPVDDNGRASFEELRQASTTVGERLRRGSLVMLRSTVPVGTTRELILPILEDASGLTVGEDVNVAFTPERTVEGQAMSELATLPQVVGGATDGCVSRAASFWRTLTDSVVHVDSLEAAELVKLANNSFRDLSFSFANGLALLADRYNLDANRLVNAANEGYPRNPVPRPSPGVGGYCLTKDPYLYAAGDPDAGHSRLSAQGRAVNSEAARYPLTVVDRYAERRGVAVDALDILLVGLAFKGWPATNDMRNSTSVEIAEHLLHRGCHVRGYDVVVPAEDIARLGLEPSAILRGAEVSDVVLILNNHPENVPEGLLRALSGRRALIFDGWSLLDPYQVEEYPELTYATLGYMTPERA